jgi:predicted enzyme related to lactoylglutathione lyase
MSKQQMPTPGQIVWVDLTVPEAEAIRDFYSQLVGWQHQPVDMGGYSDFNMTLPGTDTPAAGVCYARGQNTDLPPKWLIYIAVDNLDKSIETCLALGGTLIAGPKGQEQHRYCVVKDPAGAVVALVEVNE